MSGDLLELIAEFLGWWLVVFSSYTGLLLAADALLRRLARQKARRQREREALAQLSRQRQEAVERIGVAFLAAQVSLRNGDSAR